MNSNALIQTGLRRSSRFFIKRIRVTVNAALVIVVFLTVCAADCIAVSDADLSRLQPGMQLPELSIQHDFTPDQRRYLGLSTGFMGMFAADEFIPADVAADVLLIEFYNVYCTSCQGQAPVMNEVFNRVNTREDMRDRIRFFGIGAGNNVAEAAMFARRYSIGFPMFADPDFANYNAVGDPGATPLTVIAKKHGRDLLVVSAHAGLVKDPDFFLRKLRAALDSTPEALIALQKKRTPEATSKRPRIDLDMSVEQVKKKVLESMRAAADGDDSLKDVRLVTYPRSGEVYVAGPKGSALSLYAQVVSRPPTCDVCHGVHFILVFDANGIVRSFEPLHLTKYGNVVWSKHDADFMRRRLIGLNVLQPFVYDSAMDAVTTATMTSAIIFNSVQRLADVVNEIRSQ